MFDIKLPSETEVGLAVVCDYHIGSKNCDIGAIKRWVAEIKTEGWLVLVLGDVMDMSLKTSVGDVYDQTLSPAEQLDEATALLDPIKDQIIGTIGGNHSQRVVRSVGMDPDAMLASNLGVPYEPFITQGRIQVGDAHWKVVAHHGAGGGMMIGSKLNMAAKLSKIYPMADLLLVGHGHGDVCGSDVVYDLALNHGKVKQTRHTRHYSMCGSTLEYEGSYAEAKMLAPAQMAQMCHFLGSRKHVSKGGDYYKVKPFRRIVRYF